MTIFNSKYPAFFLLLLISYNSSGKKLFDSQLIQEEQFHIKVAQDGSGDFTTVQEAINAVSDFRRNETRIKVMNGVYNEKLILPSSKTHVTIIGESAEKTILSYNDYAQKLNKYGEELGTTGSSSFFIFGDNFRAENITFENSAGPIGQAVAVRVDGDKVVFKNCRFIGNQDTLYLHGSDSRQYYINCYIEGTTDFIFGWSTAVFENCEIFCKKGGHYITAASTNQSSKYGFVFINCMITGDAPKSSFYLGRPWREYAQTVFINTQMAALINPAGWHNWDKPNAEKTAFYAEYNSTGPGSTGQRVYWSKQLTKEQTDTFKILNIFGGVDDWYSK
ncbi:pectinesterase family protein [Gillisia sp. M10.2A]|uniref:Pectinesterase n=1 Tax=Gillisia lutea TaxID=2909668 RepID=A0ABS9EDZ0_9FLAO|nr:pectinesterase family protein [Gillisia lutea]MCF4101066.1 pectinesterase family protein [Gillisia lutea]